MKMAILKPHTSVEETTLAAEATVVTYKNLSVVERTLCSFNLVDLQVRPIYSGTFAKHAHSANTYFFVYLGLLREMAYASRFSPDAI